MIINPRREAINDCETCDHNGLIEILPRTRTAHETLTRCPHNAAELLELKRDAEADQAAGAVHRARVDVEPPHAFSEPIHHPDEEPMF